MALVGVACTFQLLTPGLLLAALPVVFVVGLQLIVVSGQPLVIAKITADPATLTDKA